VDDVAAFLKAAEALGGKVADLGPYRTFPIHQYAEGNSAAYVEDPDGNILEVYAAPGYSIDDAFDGGY